MRITPSFRTDLHFTRRSKFSGLMTISYRIKYRYLRRILAKTHKVFTNWLDLSRSESASSVQVNVNSEDYAFLATIVKVNPLPAQDAEAKYIYSS